MRINVRRVLVLSALLAQGVLYVIFWTQMISDRTLRTGTDFIAFYSAGQVADQYGTARVYDISLQQTIQQEQVGFTLAPGQVLIYNHLPYLIPLLRVLVSNNYVASFSRWALVLLALFGLAVYLLVKSLGWDHVPPWFVWLGALGFYPLFASLLNGQDTAFLVLGAALCFYFLSRNQDFYAGLGLALVTVRPHIALLLAIPFLFKRQRVLAGVLVGAVALALLSLALIGEEGTRQFIDTLLISAGGEWHGLKESAMFNLIGAVTRAFPDSNLGQVRLAGWIGYVLFAIGFGVYTLIIPKLEIRQFGLAIAFGLFFLPHLHHHDLALLLVPIFALMGFVRWPYMPLMISVILLAGFAPPLRYWSGFLVMVGLGLALSFPELSVRFAKQVGQKVE
jgi:Glycosyltransferase family 87